MTDLAALVVRMQADNSSYIKALDQATSKLSAFQKDQESLLSGLADKFAAAFSIGALVDFSASSIESEANLQKMSEAAGISVENLSALSLAGAASGLSVDELGQALKKLNVNLSDAAGNAQSKSGVAFRALGISVTDTSGNLKDAGVVMAEIADKFATLADGPNKTAIAVQLFGKQGQNLIPILDQGSAGLDRFRAQAEAAGIVLSGPLAAAAEEFEQKFAVIKATLSEGFGNQLSAQLLPVLSTLAEQFTASTSSGQAFAEVAGVIVGGVKIVAAVVIEAVSEFKQLGASIGALGAIAVAVAHGDFSEASAIWKQSNADNVATAKTAQDQITAIFEAGTDKQLSIISTTEAEKKKIQAQAPNLTAIQESDKAIAELQKYNDNLKDQAAAFGLGGAALTNYKLQFGPLADAIKKAGAEGVTLAASIRANAAALQTKQDTKAFDDFTNKIHEQILTYNSGAIAATAYRISTGTLGQQFTRLSKTIPDVRNQALALEAVFVRQQDATAIAGINDQLLTLKGNLLEAATAAFDLQHRVLSQDLAATGDTEGQKKLDELKQQTLAQAAYNEEVQKGAVIQQQFATIEANIQLQQSKGQLSDLQAQAQTEAARQQEITDLNAVYASMNNIATAAGNPKLILDTQAFQNSIKNLQTQTSALEKTVRDNLETAFADNFSKLITGAESFRQAIVNMAKDIEKQFADIISKNLAQNIFGQGGSAGGLAPFLAQLLGSGGAGGGGSAIASTGAAAVGTDTGALASSIPAFASGGTLGAGGVGLVGESGPELVYSGSQNMNIVPAGQSRPVSVTNHFTVQAPGGTISRQSQMQTAAAAARSIGQANHRNNQ
jgi:hypothetical protein